MIVVRGLLVLIPSWRVVELVAFNFSMACIGYAKYHDNCLYAILLPLCIPGVRKHRNFTYANMKDRGGKIQIHFIFTVCTE